VLIGSAAWLCLLQMRLTSPDVKPVLSPVVDTTPLVRRTSSRMAAIASWVPAPLYGMQASLHCFAGLSCKLQPKVHRRPW
jgi:hypothetical protein